MAAANKLASVSPGPMWHRIASAVLLAACLATMHWVVAGVSVLTLAVAFLVQGMGHGREVTPAIPFTGMTDAVTRILAEQFITFPRFVITGAWSAALRNAVRT
jgi:hypothetical protein